MRRAPYHDTSHATWYATALGWPILALLSLYRPDGPLDVLLMVAVLAFFALFVWTIYKMERQLNAESDSLFFPWKVRSPRTAARRIDGVLATSIRRLVSGEDEEEVLATLRLQVGELPGEAARHYDRAVARLEEAAGRDWVFDAEGRRRDLEEGEGGVHVVLRGIPHHRRQRVDARPGQCQRGPAVGLEAPVRGVGR